LLFELIELVWAYDISKGNQETTATVSRKKGFMHHCSPKWKQLKKMRIIQ